MMAPEIPENASVPWTKLAAAFSDMMAPKQKGSFVAMSWIDEEGITHNAYHMAGQINDSQAVKMMGAMVATVSRGNRDFAQNWAKSLGHGHKEILELLALIRDEAKEILSKETGTGMSMRIEDDFPPPGIN